MNHPHGKHQQATAPHRGGSCCSHGAPDALLLLKTETARRLASSVLRHPGATLAEAARLEGLSYSAARHQGMGARVSSIQCIAPNYRRFCRPATVDPAPSVVLKPASTLPSRVDWRTMSEPDEEVFQR